MWYYTITVGFNDQTANEEISSKYFDVIDKYKATGIGHDDTETSTIHIGSEKEVDIEQLTKDLEDIEILSIHKETNLTSGCCNGMCQ